MIGLDIIYISYIYNTNSVTEIINDYKSNKIKEVIIIENQDTTYKYKY